MRVLKRELLLVAVLILPGCSKSMSDAEYRRLITRTAAELKVKQNRFTARVSGYGHFDWSQDTGRLALSSPGKPTLIADFQFVGDVSKSSGTWLWAWDNPTVAEPLKRGSRTVRAFGRTERMTRLTTSKWSADQVDGWEMAGLAASILGSDAAYRTESSNGYEFLVLANLREAPEGFRVDHSGDGR